MDTAYEVPLGSIGYMCSMDPKGTLYIYIYIIQVARVPKLIQLEIRYECLRRSKGDFWKEVGRRQG